MSTPPPNQLEKCLEPRIRTQNKGIQSAFEQPLRRLRSQTNRKPIKAKKIILAIWGDIQAFDESSEKAGPGGVAGVRYLSPIGVKPRTPTSLPTWSQRLTRWRMKRCCPIRKNTGSARAYSSVAMNDFAMPAKAAVWRLLWSRRSARRNRYFRVQRSAGTTS